MRVGILIDPTGAIAPQLANPALEGWRFDPSADVESALQGVRHEDIHVGLIVLQSGAAEDRALCRLLDQPGIEWIALVTPSALLDGRLRRLIASDFFDYHTLPVDAARLAATLGHACGKAQLADPCHAIDATPEHFGMIGTSPPMGALYRDIARVVRSGAPVLIGGESGTGKELVARAIARHSARAGAPFIAVNCAAIPGSLIQSELFGHEKGAFTGAIARKIGCIEAAHGGTLFLDEIGDLPLELQANLLRFLQERTITRIGATTAIVLDVRVVAATHVDLVGAVREQRFREDLYYRLNVLNLQVPPLRERGEDVVMLAEHCLATLARTQPTPARRFSDQALAALCQHNWPGNVRELINRVQRAVVMCETRSIAAHDLGLAEATPAAPSLAQARVELDRSVIERSLHAHHHNVSRTARTLGISRVTLYRMMSRLNI